MKAKLHHFILLLCLVTSTLQAQILTEPFDNDLQIVKSHQFFTDGASDYFGIFDPTGVAHDFDGFPTPPGGVPNYTGNTGLYLIGEDLDGGPDPSTQTLTWSGLNINGFVGLELSVDLAADLGGFDVADQITFEANIDGAGFNVITQFNGSATNGVATDGTTNLSLAFQTITNTIAGTGNLLDLRLTVTATAGNEEFAIDNVLITGTPIVVCPHTIANISPRSGPVGTEVTIRGTGFTASSSVTFNGITASTVQFIDATTIIATVPAGPTTGAIVVTEATCDVTSGAGYTLLEQSGSCSAVLSGLIISEVFDNTSGSLGYIEIYNGTGATIDLTDYHIDRYGTLAAAASTHTYNFPATGVGSSIADGEVLVGRINSGGSGLEDFDFGLTVAGFNADDRLELIFTSTGTVVDDFEDAVVGAIGYLYRRSNTVTGPNPNFTASEWTTGTAGDASDLGFFNALGGSPTLSAQPTDVSGCAITLSVLATAGNGGALTYQWFFNESDGSTIGWTAVSGAAFPGTLVSGAATDALSITGNLSAYDNYQFYCQVTENGSCHILTEAAQFRLTTDRFFRSAGTGNWTNVNIWEMATSAAGPWSSTCMYPLFDNSDYIHIRSGDVVTVNQDIVVDHVVIEAGGTVSIRNSELFIINNGTGIDLNVEGTLIDNGNGNGNGINLTANSGTWILAPNGEIIKTGTSSVAQYRDSYEGGIANIPATADWRYRHNTNSGLVAVISVNMFYPNLYIESTNGGHNFTNASEVFRGINGFMTIKGNMYIGNTGTGAVQIFNNNINAGAIDVLGDLIIGGNGSVGISKFENNISGGVGTGIEVHGDLLLHTDGVLDFEDGTAATDGVVRLHGNWINLNTGNGFDEGQSTVEFVGTSNQTIDKATTSETFYNVVVNKASGTLQNNASNMVIENDMTFTNGIVLTTATSYLLFEPAATATNAFTFSHVDGPVIKETNLGSLTTFTYPTGDNGVYGAIGIETRFNLGVSYVAEYFSTGFGTYNVNGAELGHVSSLEYWMLDELVGGSVENLKVTLHWGAHSLISSPSAVRVAHFYTEAPSLVNQWEAEGASPVFTGTILSGTVTSDYVTSFSPFTLGDTLNLILLPLEMLRFEATKVDRTGLLEWEVANEQTGDRYCLERSADAQDFETLACFEATSNQAIALYRHIDESPFVGYNYYRIHQVDYTGASSYSITKALEFKNDHASILVYPNPAKGQLTLELPILMKGVYEVKVVDALGRILIASTIEEGQ
ncbi:MAG: IPT/TIG domain-containing protein, partial [uncultured Aureispira sp.]